MSLRHLFPGWGAPASAGPCSVKPQLRAHPPLWCVCPSVFSDQGSKARRIPPAPGPSVWVSLRPLIATSRSFLTARSSNLEVACARGPGTSRGGLSPLSHTSLRFLCLVLTSSLGSLQWCPVPMTDVTVDSLSNHHQHHCRGSCLGAELTGGRGGLCSWLSGAQREWTGPAHQ